MENMSNKHLRQSGEKSNVSLKPPVCLMNDEETLTPQSRLHLASKQRYTQVQQNSCPHTLQQHKSKVKKRIKT